MTEPDILLDFHDEVLNVIRPMVVIYHTNCADGLASLIVAMKAHKLLQFWKPTVGEFHSIAFQYGQSISTKTTNLLRDADVYILDFSFPPHEMEKIRKVAHRVVMIDHHESASRLWGGYREATFQEVSPGMGDNPADYRSALNIQIDDTGCGALLAHRYFTKLLSNRPTDHLVSLEEQQAVDEFYHPRMREMVLHANDYDLWKWDMADTGAWNQLLRDGKLSKLPADFQAELEDIMTVIFGDDVTFNENFSRCLDMHLQLLKRCQQYAHKAEAGTIMGYDAVVVNVSSDHTNLTADHLTRIHAGYVVICWTASTEKVFVSLRQSVGMRRDLSELAGRFGGGGHKNAAGFSLPVRALPRLLSGSLRPNLWFTLKRYFSRK